MRSAVIVSALALLALVTTWLFAGRQFVLLLDRVSTERVATLPVGPFVYSSGTMQVGDYALETSRPDGQRADIRVDVDAVGRLVLHGEGKDFPLGNRVGPPDTSGRPDISFAPAPDDVVAFSVERSRLSWPTPFAMNFMTGQSPSWRRTSISA